MKKTILLLLLPLLSFGQTYSQATKVMSWQGYDYYVSNQAFSFWDAVNHLNSIDTNLTLLSINNPRENNELTDSLYSHYGFHRYCWLGGHDTTVEGEFKWLDSSSFVYSNWYCDTNYCEPNGGTWENYIMFNFGEPGKWNDATNINDIFPYLFKVQQPTTSGGSTGGSSIGIDELNNEPRYIVSIHDFSGRYVGNDYTYLKSGVFYVVTYNTGEREKIMKGY